MASGKNGKGKKEHRGEKKEVERKETRKKGFINFSYISRNNINFSYLFPNILNFGLIWVSRTKKMGEWDQKGGGNISLENTCRVLLSLTVVHNSSYLAKKLVLLSSAGHWYFRTWLDGMVYLRMQYIGNLITSRHLFTSWTAKLRQNNWWFLREAAKKVIF